MAVVGFLVCGLVISYREVEGGDCRKGGGGGGMGRETGGRLWEEERGDGGVRGSPEGRRRRWNKD